MYLAWAYMFIVVYSCIRLFLAASLLSKRHFTHFSST